MVSLLAFSLISITVKSQLPAPTLQPTVSVPAGEIPSVCIWGRNNAEHFNTGFLGQYYYDGLTSAGRTAWKLVSHSSCSSTPYYVKRNAASTQWWISDGKDSDSSYAKCYETDIDDCTANKWLVYEKSGAYEVDSEMYSKTGDCPNWNCKTVSLNRGATYCQEFTQQLGDNAWKDSSNYVWYFNPIWWSWICVDNAQYSYEACSVSYMFSVNGWKDLTSGNSVALSPTITATCDGTGNQPTPQPTDPTVATQPTPPPVVSAPTLPPLVTVPSGEFPSICIWDRTHPDNYNTGFNGQFYYDGTTSAGRTSYKLVSCSSTWYVYRNAGNVQWWISDVKGADSHYAKCSETDIASCTAGKWSVYEQSNQWETDSTMYAKTGDCPNWDCGSISISGGNPYCQEFTQQLGDNAWKGTSGNNAGYVWYFNPVWWMWICVDNTQWSYDDCDASYMLSAEGWKDLSSGNSINLNTPTQYTITVSCGGTGNQPTPQPIVPTAGTQPTPKPTDKPTYKPTDKPTDKPTPKPTDKPIVPGTPTNKPTPQPTDKPIVPGTPTTTTTASIPTTPTMPTTPITPTMPTTTTVDTDSELDCVGISNLDNGELNGNWNKEGTSGGHSMYSLGNYWLYFVDEGSHKYWMIGEVQGSADRSTILAYCLKDDVTHCSGAFWEWNEDVDPGDYVEESDSLVINCSNEADDGGVMGAAAGIVGGIVKMWWFWVIIAIIVVCCCCGCIVCLWKRKKGKAYFSARDEDDWYL